MSVAVRPGVAPLTPAMLGLTFLVVAVLALGFGRPAPTVEWPTIFPAHAPVQSLPAPPANPPAPAFVMPARYRLDRVRAERCLAQAVYFEAGFQPLAGKRAVAQVVVNRVRDRNFPHSVCGVVYQGWRRGVGCQFSFVCDGSLWRRPPTDEEMASAKAVARQALSGYVETAVGTATHYHSRRVNPAWAPTLVKTARIGDHIFYRWPGAAGRPQALAALGDETPVTENIPRIGQAPARA